MAAKAGLGHQLPPRPVFIQTLRTSAAESTGAAGHARVPKEPQQPPLSQVRPLSPVCSWLLLIGATHLQPGPPGRGGSRERWAQAPLGGAEARGSPCPRAGGGRSQSFGDDAEVALRRRSGGVGDGYRFYPGCRGLRGARYKGQRGHWRLSTPRRLRRGRRLPAPQPRSLILAVGGSRSIHTPAPPPPIGNSETPKGVTHP